jgi:hypothetical protein
VNPRQATQSPRGRWQTDTTLKDFSTSALAGVVEANINAQLPLMYALCWPNILIRRDSGQTRRRIAPTGETRSRESVRASSRASRHHSWTGNRTPITTTHWTLAVAHIPHGELSQRKSRTDGHFRPGQSEKQQGTDLAQAYSLGPELDPFVDELLMIDRTDGLMEVESGSSDSQLTHRHKRGREIGEILVQ